MPATTTIETPTANSDLMISEFDQWTNPAESNALFYASFCICRSDTDLAE